MKTCSSPQSESTDSNETFEDLVELASGGDNFRDSPLVAVVEHLRRMKDERADLFAFIPQAYEEVMGAALVPTNPFPVNSVQPYQSQTDWVSDIGDVVFILNWKCYHKKKSSNWWVKHFEKPRNHFYEKVRMATAPDVYHFFKVLDRSLKSNDPFKRKEAQSKSSEIMDFVERVSEPKMVDGIITDTMVEHDSDSSSSAIHHGRVSMVEEPLVVIPVYLDMPIQEVVQDSYGLSYLQTLFQTEDSAEDIIENLMFDNKIKQILITTAPLEKNSSYTTRKICPRQNVSLSVNDDEKGLYIKLSNYSDLYRALGVFIK